MKIENVNYKFQKFPHSNHLPRSLFSPNRSQKTHKLENVLQKKCKALDPLHQAGLVRPNVEIGWDSWESIEYLYYLPLSGIDSHTRNQKSATNHIF